MLDPDAVDAGLGVTVELGDAVAVGGSVGVGDGDAVGEGDAVGDDDVVGEAVAVGDGAAVAQCPFLGWSGCDGLAIAGSALAMSAMAADTMVTKRTRALTAVLRPTFRGFLRRERIRDSGSDQAKLGGRRGSSADIKGRGGISFMQACAQPFGRGKNESFGEAPQYV